MPYFVAGQTKVSCICRQLQLRINAKLSLPLPRRRVLFEHLVVSSPCGV